LGLIIYSNTFKSPFRLDDDHTIVNNFSIRDLSNIKAIWDFWPTRFIVDLSLALNYHFNHLNVFGYHLINLIIHLVASLLVWWLALLTFYTPALKNSKITSHARLLSFFAGLVFVAHPIQTQAVTYIIQRTTALAALFYLAALSFYVKSRLLRLEKPTSMVWKIPYSISLICAVLAMFTKEMTITLPFMVLLYEFSFFKTRKTIDKKLLTPYLIILLVIPLAMLITKSVNFMEMRRVAEYQAPASPYHYLLTQFRVMVTYLRLLFMPIHQNFDYDYPVANSIFQIPVALSLLLLLLILGIAFKLLNKYKLISLAIFWFFLTLLPESSVIPITDVIFEHRLYLPMAGFSLFLVSALYYLLKQKTVKFASVLLCLLVVCYSVLTYQRNIVWKDEISLWSDTIRRSPLKARPYINRGLAYAAKGNYDQAMADYNQAITSNSIYAEAYLNQGIVYYAQRKYDQALADFNQALVMNPNFAQAYNNRGAVYYAKGDFDPAIDDYTQAVKLNPNFAEAYYNRGLIFDTRGNSDLALADFNQAIKIDPEYKAAYTKRGEAYIAKGNSDQALADYDQIVKTNPYSAEAYINRGMAYAAKGNSDQALADFNQAINISPNHPHAAESYNNRGIIYYAKGDSDTAIVDFNRALNINPNYAEAYSNRGLSYAAKGNYDQAINDYTQAIKLNPIYAEAYYNRGIIYYGRGNSDQALADFNQAIKINPNFADAYVNRAAIYYAKGNSEGALSDLNQAINLNPSHPKAYSNRGTIYYAKGNYDQAITDYAQAVNIDPKYAEAYYNRGFTYNAKGNLDRALADFDKAINLNPDYTDALRSRAEVFFRKLEYNRSWEDVNKLRALGAEVPAKLLDDLKKATGREG
jgi:tetratricopeptide (TPR) repeat protein